MPFVTATLLLTAGLVANVECFASKSNNSTSFPKQKWFVAFARQTWP